MSARVAALLALALAAGGALAAAAEPDRGEGRVLVVRLEGVVSPVSAEAVIAAVDRAEREGYRALVLEVDTPGGLESSMRDMVKRLLASEVPVLAWVTPGGARAASAGVFIVMAADFAAMAPGTNIGAATPVNMGGPMDSTLARKAANDAAAFARTVAAQRGRNSAWAERAVREAVAVADSEAVALRIVDAIAGTLPELLERADGRRWRRGGEARTLEVAGLPHDRIHPGLRQRLLSVIADPNVAYILLMIGFYGMLFELQNPGAILPGIVGAICLVLAFLALSALPVNYAGLALIVLGVVFLLAEVKVTSHGLLGAGGVASMLLGSLILFHGEGARVSLSVILGATLATALFFLFVVGTALRSRKGPVVTGARGMIGRRVQAIERLAPTGRVRYGDELWNAVSSGEVEAGSDVEITGVDGLTLRVRPVHREV
jgi:membrane-bound serine protease (ClpP class)